MAERLNINPLTMAVNETGTDDIESILVVLNYFTILTNTIKLIICLCVVPVDIFLITTISKSKKLQTKTNEYIKHYSIFNLIYMVASPLLWFILELGALTRYLGINIYCMILQVDASSILFCQLFAFGLALEWLLKSRNSKERLGKIREYLVRIIYVGGFLGFITHNILCFTHYWRVRYMMGYIAYAIISIFILICNYLEYNNYYSGDSDYELTIANIMIFSWLPYYLYKVLIYFTRDTVLPRIVINFTVFISEWLAYGCPIFVLVMLWQSDMSFRITYKHIFRKQRKKKKLERSDDKSGYDIETSVQKHIMAFDNNTTYI